MRSLLYASLAGAVLVTSTGCLGARAKTPEPLNMPEPPARVVTPPTIPVEPPPAVVPPQPQPAQPTLPAAPPPASGGGTTSRPTQNATPPPVTAPPPDNPPVLQTVQNTQDLENKIRFQLESGRRDLDRVDRRQLSKHALAQYDLANSLWREADEAFKRKNFPYADAQSQKVVIMAALLAKGFPEPSPIVF
jgi:hypothetical protein